MFTASQRNVAPSARSHVPPRRGVALVFVLVFTVVMAALAMASIFMGSNATLLAKSYDRERDLKAAAEFALAQGKARLNKDQNYMAGIATGQLYRTLYPAPIPVTGADGSTLPGINVQVYIGQTGSTSGQNGRFASVVAVATDQRGSRFIRRLELTQESFAKFAYWSNSESNNGSTIFFNNGDQLWGPVWSNDVISIGTAGATFHDNVGTAKTISGKANGVFVKTPLEGQPVINLPSTAALSTLSGYATTAGWNFTTADGATNDETKVRDRIEFIAYDAGGTGDSTSDNDGFFRVYTANSGNESLLRGDWPVSYGSVPSVAQTNFCGDWHYMPSKSPSDTGVKFYPASVHRTTWFRAQVESAYVQRNSWPGYASAHAKAVADSAEGLSVGTVLNKPNARCFLAGDPHLVAVDRVALQTKPLPQVGAYTALDVQKGGEDTTFTPVGRYGAWKAVGQTTANAPIATQRPWDGRYLYSIGHLFNPNSKGVIYFTGNVGVSGIVNGQVTMYSKGNIVILDDLRYANDPVTSRRCHDILGLISDYDVVVADNALNDPQVTNAPGAVKTFSLDETKDIYIHSVIMALGTSFRVQNYDQGATAVNNCDTSVNGRGCIYLSGGLIQSSRGAVGTSSGSGYAKRYTYDHCAIITPPPYFPTTGRFQDNRYLELDPAGFDPQKYFLSITPDP